MTNIGEVIGWKFNHQPGMSTKEGVITEFPGGIPSQIDQDIWTADYQAANAATAYRQNRANAYVAELGGDVLDVVIAELRARGADATAAFTALVSKIDAIKTRYPKP